MGTSHIVHVCHRSSFVYLQKTNLWDWSFTKACRARNAAFSSSMLMCGVNSWLDHFLEEHQPTSDASERIAKSGAGGVMGLPLTECKLVIDQDSSARLGELRIIGYSWSNWWSFKVCTTRIWRALKCKGNDQKTRQQDSRVPNRLASCRAAIPGWQRALAQAARNFWTSSLEDERSNLKNLWES